MCVALFFFSICFRLRKIIYACYCCFDFDFGFGFVWICRSFGYFDVCFDFFLIWISYESESENVMRTKMSETERKRTSQISWISCFFFYLQGFLKKTTTNKRSRDLCLFVHIYVCVCLYFCLFVCLFVWL